VAGREIVAAAEAARARCAELRQAGEGLKHRPVLEIVSALDAACARWRDPSDGDRRSAEAALAVRYGVPERSIATIVDAAFGRWDGAALRRWMEAELGPPEVLDVPTPIGAARRLAIGPDLVVALSAHGVPTTPVADLLAALLVKAPIWLKPASGSDDLAARFAATVAAVDPGMGAAVETAGWPTGSPIGGAVLAGADVVVATGREETVALLRREAPTGARLVVHGPRLSAAVVTREALVESRERVVATLADDAAFAGQMGCLSPVVAWIEAPPLEIEALLEPLQAACTKRWPAPARSEAPVAERARFGEWLALAGVERAAGSAGHAAGGFEAAWTVQARARAEPPIAPPVPRLLLLASVDDARATVDLCAQRRGLVATVGLAAPAERAAALASEMARAGVERVAPLGAMQTPPLDWRRDGRATLAELVRWFDWDA
jgi:hypothetical protein